MKQPVPYVFLTMPGWWQAWPNVAACWSPAMPATGMAPPNSPSRVLPTSSLDDTTCGSICSGMSNRSSMSWSQRIRWILNSMVRAALLTSVTWRPVSLYTSQLSMVPKASAPWRARSRAPGTWSSSHLSLVAEK